MATRFHPDCTRAKIRKMMLDGIMGTRTRTVMKDVANSWGEWEWSVARGMCTLELKKTGSSAHKMSSAISKPKPKLKRTVKPRK